MLVTILGSCANQIADREAVALMVETMKGNVLIDCGPGIVSAVGKAKRKCSDINNLILTHVHGDHISGFSYFVWNRNFERMGNEPAADLDVYGQEDTINVASFMLEKTYPEMNFPFKVNYHVVNADTAPLLNICDMRVSIIKADHAVPAISCVIESDNKKMVYSSDTVPTATLEEVSSSADLLVFEGMMDNRLEGLASNVKHSTAKQAGIFAQKTNAKSLVLVHVAPMLLGNEGLLISEAKEQYDGQVSILYDGSVVGI